MAKWSIPDLSKKIPANLLDPSLLEKVYIPNLVASLFTVNKAYAELIYNCTSSLHLLKVLHKWNEERWDTPKWQQKFACACSHQPRAPSTCTPSFFTCLSHALLKCHPYGKWSYQRYL